VATVASWPPSSPGASPCAIASGSTRRRSWVCPPPLRRRSLPRRARRPRRAAMPSAIKRKRGRPRSRPAAAGHPGRQREARRIPDPEGAPRLRPGAGADLHLKGVPFKGPAEAPIRVVEFSDFLCPFCRQIASAFAGYIPQSANRVVVYFKNYPLDSTCNSTLKQPVPRRGLQRRPGRDLRERARASSGTITIASSPPAHQSPGERRRVHGARSGLDAARSRPA
jgi:hypothetical protein